MDLERQDQIRQRKAAAVIRSKKRNYREMERNPPDRKAYECFKNDPYRIPVRGRQE